MLPIYVNAYLPPQPTMERCYAFGQAVARTVTAMGLKTVILSSGGMSHFPGTDRYSNPELAWDNRALEKLAAGNLKSLIGYDETELDDTGNIELRCWACAAGALGERKPDVVSMDPSWHHNYASLAWFGGAAASKDAHYPAIRPELVELTSALHGLAHDAQMRAHYVADAPAYADRFRLSPDQREALIRLDMPAIVKMGTHPLCRSWRRCRLHACARRASALRLPHSTCARCLARSHFLTANRYPPRIRSGEASPEKLYRRNSTHEKAGFGDHRAVPGVAGTGRL